MLQHSTYPKNRQWIHYAAEKTVPIMKIKLVKAQLNGDKRWQSMNCMKLADNLTGNLCHKSISRSSQESNQILYQLIHQVVPDTPSICQLAFPLYTFLLMPAYW